MVRTAESALHLCREAISTEISQEAGLAASLREGLVINALPTQREQGDSVVMKSLRTLFTIPVLGVVVALAGCSAESGTNGSVENPNTAQGTSQASTEGSSDRAEGPRRGPGGPDFLVQAALREDIGLTAEQRTTIQSLVESSRPTPPANRGDKAERPQHDAAKTAALAAAIRTGNVEGLKASMPAPDAAKIAEHESKMKEHMKEHQAKLATALTKLHDTLTAEQRTKLVDAIIAKAPKQGERPDGSKSPRPEGEKGARGPHMHGGPGAMGGGLLQGIELTQAQKDALTAKMEAKASQVRAARPSDEQIAKMKAAHASMKASLDAKLQSFKGDSFDANAFVTPPEGAFGPRPGMAGHDPKRMNEELATIVSVLDASQREILAKKIEAGPRFDRPAMAPRTRQAQ